MNKLFTVAASCFFAAISISCDNENKTLGTDNAIILNEGKKIAQNSFKTLSSELKKAIKESGAVGGIKVCNTKAMPLTDSLSVFFGVEIKRTSLKIRNESNMPDSMESKVLNDWMADMSNSVALEPKILEKENDKIVFLSPIIMKPICLTCHGNRSQIPPVVKAKLMRYYPNDDAIEYKEGDLRGAWVITFPKDYFSKKDLK